MTKMPMHSNSKDAIEIYEFLRDKLSLPDNVTSFVLTFKHEELLEVKCTYYPRVQYEYKKSWRRKTS